LYSSLLEIIPKQPQPEGYDLLPAQALPVPSPAEISSRWPGMSPDQAEAIAQDYKSESDELAELALDDVYHRVRELVVREVVWGSGS
jgi:nuclear pore complex protein Nup133